MTKTMEKIDIDRVIESIEDGDYTGFCTSCGAERDGCEPDAQRYMCDECGLPCVYGAEELLIMGF